MKRILSALTLAVSLAVGYAPPADTQSYYNAVCGATASTDPNDVTMLPCRVVVTNDNTLARTSQKIEITRGTSGSMVFWNLRFTGVGNYYYIGTPGSDLHSIQFRKSDGIHCYGDNSAALCFKYAS